MIDTLVKQCLKRLDNTFMIHLMLNSFPNTALPAIKYAVIDDLIRLLSMQKSALLDDLVANKTLPSGYKKMKLGKHKVYKAGPLEIYVIKGPKNKIISKEKLVNAFELLGAKNPAQLLASCTKNRSGSTKINVYYGATGHDSKNNPVSS